MTANAKESAFQQDIIDQMVDGGWKLGKADPQASDKSLRTFGTLGVLRHEQRDKSASFKLCQFKPEHGLNPSFPALLTGGQSQDTVLTTLK